MIETLLKLKRSDWIRFQVHSDRRVLEGFIQEISEDGQRLKIGKEPDGPESEWFSLSEISILHRQGWANPA